MKRLNKISVNFLVFSLIMISFQSQAQKRGKAGDVNWFSISVKGGYGTSMLMNKNIFGDEKVTGSYFNPGFCYGGKLGFHFTNTVSINAEILLGSISQKFDVKTDVLKYTHAINLTTIDFPILLRFMGERQGYAEIGASISTIKSASESFSKTTSPLPGGDVMSSFKKGSTNLVLGIGNPIFKGETFTFNLGARINYALTDITSDKSYPFNDLYTPANGDAKTNPFTAFLMAEFHYYLGYFATSSCGKRKGFIFF